MDVHGVNDEGLADPVEALAALLVAGGHCDARTIERGHRVAEETGQRRNTPDAIEICYENGPNVSSFCSTKSNKRIGKFWVTAAAILPDFSKAFIVFSLNLESCTPGIDRYFQNSRSPVFSC